MANEIIYKLKDCLNNLSYIRFKKNDNDEFRLTYYNDHCRFAYSNLQLSVAKHDLEWLADSGEFESVEYHINHGKTSRTIINKKER